MADEKKLYSDAQLENVNTNDDGSLDVGFDPPTAEEEAAVIRKLDLRLLPFVFVLYSLSVLDRSNLGNAKLAFLGEDIDLSGKHYDLLGTIFYVGYIVFQFTTAGWKQFPPHRWGAFVIFFWGFVATVQAAAFNWAGLMTCRFFLGIAEAGFGPGVPLYLSFFYPREKVGFRHGVFIAGAAMANVYGSLLAYGITQIRGSLAPWQILFIIEGLPTCVLAVFGWFFLPDSIEKAPFFNDREKYVAARMTARNQIVDEGDNKTGVRFKELLEAFKDPKSYLPAIMYFSVNVSYASLPLFVPTIINEIGRWTTVQSQGLSAPPYAVCFFMILFASWLSDRLKVRGPLIFAAGLVGAVGFIMLATLSSPTARYVGIFLAVEVFVAVSLLLSWTANLHETESKRTGGYIVLSTIGQCGPVLGTNIFPAAEGPRYLKGMWISTAFCLVIVVCSVALSLWLIKENRDMERAGILYDPAVDGEIKTAGDRNKLAGKRFRHVW